MLATGAAAQHPNGDPSRVERGMGRSRRYGQAGSVWVYNLAAANARERSVLQKVVSKLDVRRGQMGYERAYEVSDHWQGDMPLVRLIENAIHTHDESARAQGIGAPLSMTSTEKTGPLMAAGKPTFGFADRQVLS